MKASPHATPLWFRLSALGLGILLLFWLPVEDLDERWASGFGAATSALLAARYLTMPVFSPATSPAGEDSQFSELAQRPASRPWWSFPVAGALAGLAVPLLAVLLMIFKMGLHGHANPDFTPEQFQAVFYRTPVFILTGVFVGLGIGLYKSAIRSKPLLPGLPKR